MLTKYQIKIIQDFMPPACTALMKKNNLTCSVTATRVAYDVLTKSHFKVRPLAVEAKVYNPLYAAKLRPPDTEEEAKQWFEEGCACNVLHENMKVANKFDGHLVAIINDICILDLAIVKVYCPEKKLIVNPVFAEINQKFIDGEIQRGVENNGCLIVYKAVPENQDFLRYKDWIDRKSIENLEREICHAMRRKPAKIVHKARSSPILKEAKQIALREGSHEIMSMPLPSVMPSKETLPLGDINV